MSNFFITLQQRLPSLSKAERRIAEVVLADPAGSVDNTIVELATRADTSQATVARFCQNLGYNGYREFRLALAGATSREETTRELFSVSDADVLPTDSLTEVLAKVAYQEARTIEETARGIDHQHLDAAVSAITAADRIEVFGSGSSDLAAQDLTQKLMRLGFRCSSWGDIHFGLTSVALATPQTTVFAISHTGTTPETLELLDLGNERGATTIAITNTPGSPLSELADLTLLTSARDTRYRAGAMSSRIAQMAVIDFLVVRLLQQQIDTTSDALAQTHAALQRRHNRTK